MIRTASESDIPEIERLMRSEPRFWNEEWPADVLRKAIHASDGLAFVWEEGAICGFVCAHNLGFRGYLSELIVSKTARGKNVGARLLERIEDELGARGCPLVIADIWKSAEPFYRKARWKSPGVVLLTKKIKR